MPSIGLELLLILVSLAIGSVICIAAGALMLHLIDKHNTRRANAHTRINGTR